MQATIIITTCNDVEDFKSCKHCASLVGAWLLPPCWLTTPHGSFRNWALKYRAAILTKRFVWLSPDACTSLPTETAMIRAAASLPSSKWVLVGDLQDWVDRKQRAANSKCPSSVIALVTSPEQAAFSEVGHMFDINGFFEFVSNFDAVQSSMGLSNV